MAHHVDDTGALRPEYLEPGDWISFEFGYEETLFYVVSVGERAVTLGNPEWLVRSTVTRPHTYLREVNPTYLANTKARWWWPFMPMRQLICPFQSPGLPRKWWR